MHAREPQARIRHPLLDGVAERRLDARAHVAATAVRRRTRTCRRSPADARAARDTRTPPRAARRRRAAAIDIVAQHACQQEEDGGAGQQSPRGQIGPVRLVLHDEQAERDTRGHEPADAPDHEGDERHREDEQGPAGSPAASTVQQTRTRARTATPRPRPSSTMRARREAVSRAMAAEQGREDRRGAWTSYRQRARACPSRHSSSACSLDRQRARRSSRSMSRRWSRSRIASRLSRCSLPLRERELHLRPRAGEVDPRRNEGQPLLLRLADQALDLLAVHQQLPRPLGVVAFAGGGLVRRDVAVVEPHLAVPHERVGVLQVHLAVAQRLHLAALQRDAGLPALEQVVLEPRLAVRRHVAGTGGGLRVAPAAHRSRPAGRARGRSARGAARRTAP